MESLKLLDGIYVQQVMTMIYIYFYFTSLGGATIAFFGYSSDSNYLASTAWNYSKLHTRYTYYMALHSLTLYTNRRCNDAMNRFSPN